MQCHQLDVEFTSGIVNRQSFYSSPATKTLGKPINMCEIKAGEDLVRGAQFPLAPLWIDALSLGNINVLVALVLSQLPNLQTLHLDQDFFANSQFLGLLFQHALSPKQSSSWPVSNFSCLHNISLFTRERVQLELHLIRIK